MDYEYLLIYGEGKQDESHFHFHPLTPEEAVQTAQRFVDVRKKQAEKPERFHAKLYQEVHVW